MTKDSSSIKLINDNNEGQILQGPVSNSKKPDQCSLNKINENNENPKINKNPFNNNLTQILINVNKKIFNKYEGNDNWEKQNNYFILKKLMIGKGGYGYVHFFIDLSNYKAFIIKIAHKNKEYYPIETNNILREKGILDKLKKYEFFPVIYDLDIKNISNAFITETLYGPDLKILHKFCEKEFDIRTILYIAIDAINFFSKIHGEGYIYNDVRDKNFVWNCFSDNDSFPGIVIIDYNICPKFDKNLKRTYMEYEEAEKNNPISVNQKEDLESLIYLLLMFTKYEINWQEMNNRSEGLKIKNYNDYDLEEINIIYKDIVGLARYEDPKYELYIKMLKNKLEIMNKNSQNNFKFKWEEVMIKMLKEDYFNGRKKIYESLFKGFPEEFVFEFLDYFAEKNGINIIK